MVRREHPQTIALIVAHLEQDQASKLLARLDRSLAGEVLCRVASMEKVSPDVLHLVQAGLSGQAELSISREATSSGGPSVVAKLLNRAEGETGAELLEAIQGRDEEMAGKIKSLMFTFEDLLLIDSKGMQRILREIESKDLALALKAASEELKVHIRSSMSERAGAALEEEIELLGAVRVRDVEAAHERIIEIVRQLDESGEILIRRQGGNDDFIE
jgi:flagellar motor switch protein FliG